MSKENIIQNLPAGWNITQNPTNRYDHGRMLYTLDIYHKNNLIKSLPDISSYKTYGNLISYLSNAKWYIYDFAEQKNLLMQPEGSFSGEPDTATNTYGAVAIMTKPKDSNGLIVMAGGTCGMQRANVDLGSNVIEINSDPFLIKLPEINQCEKSLSNIDKKGDYSDADYNPVLKQVYTTSNRYSEGEGEFYNIVLPNSISHDQEQQGRKTFLPPQTINALPISTANGTYIAALAKIDDGIKMRIYGQDPVTGAKFNTGALATIPLLDYANKNPDTLDFRLHSSNNADGCCMQIIDTANNTIEEFSLVESMESPNGNKEFQLTKLTNQSARITSKATESITSATATGIDKIKTTTLKSLSTEITNAKQTTDEASNTAYTTTEIVNTKNSHSNSSQHTERNTITEKLTNSPETTLSTKTTAKNLTSSNFPTIRNLTTRHTTVKTTNKTNGITTKNRSKTTGISTTTKRPQSSSSRPSYMLDNNTSRPLYLNTTGSINNGSTGPNVLPCSATNKSCKPVGNNIAITASGADNTQIIAAVSSSLLFLVIGVICFFQRKKISSYFKAAPVQRNSTQSAPLQETAISLNDLGSSQKTSSSNESDETLLNSDNKTFIDHTRKTLSNFANEDADEKILFTRPRNSEKKQNASMKNTDSQKVFNNLAFQYDDNQSIESSVSI